MNLRDIILKVEEEISIRRRLLYFLSRIDVESFKLNEDRLKKINDCINTCDIITLKNIFDDHSLDNLTRGELLEMAKSWGIRYYSRLNKEDLIQQIKDARECHQKK